MRGPRSLLVNPEYLQPTTSSRVVFEDCCNPLDGVLQHLETEAISHIVPPRNDPKLPGLKGGI